MANLVYNAAKEALLLGSFNFEGATNRLYMALVSNSYTPDGDVHAYHASLSHIVTPSNYTAYILVSSPLVTTNNTSNQGVLDAADLLLANVTFGTTVRAGVLFWSSGLGSASDPLIAYMDFVTDQSVTASTFQVQFNASGVLALT